MKIRIPFGKFQMLGAKDHDFEARSFRCPRCGADVIAQSVMEIVCECGAEGNKQHFSSVERKAA